MKASSLFNFLDSVHFFNTLGRISPPHLFFLWLLMIEPVYKIQILGYIFHTKADIMPKRTSSLDGWVDHLSLPTQKYIDHKIKTHF